MSLFTEIPISILRRDRQKISYERRSYESVDEKSLILCYVLKKGIWSIKGWSLIVNYSILNCFLNRNFSVKQNNNNI